MEQGVLELDGGAGDAVEQHVELADRPGRSVVDLAGEAQVGGVAAGLLDVLPADDEHTARAAARVVHAHAGSWLEDTHHEANDVARGVKVAALLAGRLGEHVDEELVGRAEQVGELEILIAQAVTAEVPHQVAARVVGDDPLGALGAHEADVVEDVLERLVGFRERSECLVEDCPVGLHGVGEAVV